jgi:hypothetical protein
MRIATRQIVAILVVSIAAPTVTAPPLIFRFESDECWLNLHSFLYVLGRAEDKFARADCLQWIRWPLRPSSSAYSAAPIGCDKPVRSAGAATRTARRQITEHVARLIVGCTHPVAPFRKVGSIVGRWDDHVDPWQDSLRIPFW